MLSGGPTNRDAVEECDDGGGPPGEAAEGLAVAVAHRQRAAQALRARCGMSARKKGRSASFTRFS